MPNIFLSYTRADSGVMESLTESLRRLGLNIWVDVEHLTPGTEQWMRAVRRAVSMTDGMLVLCSPSAERSDWVNREIRLAKLAGKPIIPILIAGEEVDAIPTELIGTQYFDMRRGSIDPESDFRDFVAALSKVFPFDVPDYDIEGYGGKQIPSVIYQVQMHGGQIISIGGDVSGTVNVAGGTIDQSTDPIASKPHDLPRNFWANRFPAILAVVFIAGMLGIGGAALGMINRLQQAEAVATPSPTSPPTQKLTILGTLGVPGLTPVDEPTAAPTTTTGSPEPTRNPAYVLAESGGIVTNSDWTPYTEDIDGVLMALVPKGCFKMGSADGPANESPVHEVCFDAPFWIDVYEVTNAQYGSWGCSDYSSADSQPRNCVNWMDADAHCTARGARLPSEAEWEYAARGPDGLVYPWGNDFKRDAVVWNRTQTANVGSEPDGASWVGALDLSGNVWEWVADWYGDDYYTTLGSRAVNPTGPGTGSYRVLRGGSWNETGSDNARTSFRGWNAMSNLFSYYGFRCARAY